MELGMEYKDYKLIFDSNSLKIDSSIEGYEVMNSWEHPLMKKHAEVVCQNGGDILEIGFGMGISANYIQSHNINSHTIVEIHPQVIQFLENWSKNKSNVIIIEGDWYNKIEKICNKKYDGIFFDTHMDKNACRFKELVVDKCLKEGGVYTWFAPREDMKIYKNVIFEIVEVDPKDCSYYDLKQAVCPYYISTKNQIR
jgi:protein arginine N-methyltransferase 2